MKKIELAEMNGYTLYRDSEGYDIRHSGYGVVYSFFISFQKLDNNKGQFKIASTSYGMHTEDELQELIESYEAALKTVKYFKTVMADNTDITF